MTGPMDRVFGRSAFDLNRDGKISAAEWAFIDETLFSEDKNEEEDDDDLDDLGLDDSDDFGDDF